ncbi:hypothetical protein TSOC_002561 [Tetrabaena socialis]|uniref:Uncharacterized protein n=1 Tax=Tetrabaena socialis TaxID=47790 RepID=A0A2J8ADV7_9CHLO|nr:hypothetical protein TSOC_002561 [Tetrabaena socialis]|eukprot:PNH10692.1 hypothetical protein TSOC_002561 [Tetrabaena socialis]
MARPYRNSDTRAFNLPIGRPGAGRVGYIGQCILGELGSPDVPPYERMVLRSWHWLDEEQGLLGQTNVTSSDHMGNHELFGYIPRDGEPAHYEKQFKFSWADMSPARYVLQVAATNTYVVARGHA